LSEDEDALAQELRGFLETPLHRLMGLKVVQQQSPSVVMMELSDQFRGAAPGSVHGGMLATLADEVWGARSSTPTTGPSFARPRPT